MTARTDKTTVVIIAAGQGTRMRSETPKALHTVCGRPLVLWPVHAALNAGLTDIVVVLGSDSAVAEVLPSDTRIAVQQTPRGTGDAVAAARDQVLASGDPGDQTVIVLSGDTPLVTSELVRQLAATAQNENFGMTVVTATLNHPGSYGRIVRDADGNVLKIVEAKADGDATTEELRICEVNTGIYVFNAAVLFDALEKIDTNNAQGEYYLTDVLPIIQAGGHSVVAHELDDPDDALGVNDRVDLATVQQIANAREITAHQQAGVTFIAPTTNVIEAGVVIGSDTVIEPGTYLRGRTTVGADCVIGPNTTITDSQIEDGAKIIQSFLTEARVGSQASIGPFAYLRPGANIGAGAKIGTFVEVKNSNIGPGSKVPHLSYLGDADIGERSNIGAGNITANYDGRDKHRTTVGDDVRTGVNTSLVAPVTLGDAAYTGAGSVITEDVPPGNLGIARNKQKNVDGYAERKADRTDD